jgi:hypothetical protein
VAATIYEEKKGDGLFYRSKGDTFKINNAFVKEFHDYTHKLY